MKKILIVLLLTVTAFGQDYKARDTITKHRIDFQDNVDLSNANLTNLYNAISDLQNTIELYYGQTMLNTSNTTLQDGDVFGYDYDPAGVPGQTEIMRNLNIDIILSFSQKIREMEARIKQLEDTIKTFAPGTITYQPVYVFNYSPSQGFGTTKQIGQDSTKTLYIKNTGNIALRISAVNFETDDANRLCPFTYAIKNRTSGTAQDTVTALDSIKLEITYTPYDVGYADDWRMIITHNGGANNTLDYDTLTLTGSGAAVPIEADYWANTGVGAGGWFRSIKYHTQNRNIVYMMGDLSGFYKSTDGGATWSPKNVGLLNYRGEDIAVHPTDGNILLLATDGGIYKSTNAGENWDSVGTNVTGTPSYLVDQPNISISAVHICEANPDIWYAGTTGYPTHSHYAQTDGLVWKLYKSTNAGVSWDSVAISTTLRGDASIISITSNPENANIIYLSTTKRFIKLHNGGTMAQALETNSGYKMNYGGTTYSGSWCAVVDPKDTSRVYSGLFSTGTTQFNNLRVSTDGGTTWAIVNNTTVGAIAEEIKFDKANTNKIYAGWRKAYTNQFYVSLDNGATWNSRGVLQSNVNSGWYVFEPVTSFDVYNDTLIYCANMIARSFNSDSTFMNLEQCYTTGKSPYWTTTGAEIKITWDHFFAPTDSNWVLASTADSPLMLTTNAGTTWRVLSNAGVFKLGTYSLLTTKTVAIKDTLTFWAGQSDWKNNLGTVIKTTDGGNTWALANNKLPTGTNYADSDPYTLCYVGGDTVLVNIDYQGIYYTTDGGVEWTKSTATNGAYGSTTVARGSTTWGGKQIAVDRLNRKIIYASITSPNYGTERNFRGMWKSTNGGVTFTKYDTVNVRGVTSIAIHPDSSSVVWISQVSTANADGIGGIWKSTNGGESFTKKFSGDLTYPRFTSIAFGNTPGLMYASAVTGYDTNGLWNGEGVYRSTDYGNNWSLYNDGLGGYHRITSITTSQESDQVWLGTQGHGSFKLIKATE